MQDMTSQFPLQLNWTAAQLADAVPMKLHERYRFVATPADGLREGGADAGARRPARRRLEARACLDPPSAALPTRFRIG